MEIFTDGFFSVDPKHGFLPISEPLIKLPKKYEALQFLIDEMPIRKSDGIPGLLASKVLLKLKSKLFQIFWKK